MIEKAYKNYIEKIKPAKEPKKTPNNVLSITPLIEAKKKKEAASKLKTD
jgi:hypothetical protein